MLLPPMNHPVRDWRGKRIWLVGASSGIGAALARQALQAGAMVALSARRADALASLAQGAENPKNTLVAPLDVLDEHDWQRQYEHIKQAFGAIDLLVFCVARYQPERSWEVGHEQARETICTNLASAYAGLATILPDMLARGSGGVALVASVAGYVGLPGATVYGPTKAALINLAEILYNDLHGRGLDVYLINPGFVKTALTDKNDFAMPAMQTPEQAASAIWHGIAQGRFEIHFPHYFTRMLKLFKLLPFRWRASLVQRLLPVPRRAP